VAWSGSARKTTWCRTSCRRTGFGDALAISRADIASPSDPRLIRSQLARWVDDVRSVYVDVAAEKHVINEA
jgi:type IV secretory pathway TrbF-like protein